MIHIENNWYVSVNGYKNYTLGTYKKTKIADKEVEVLDNATYHSSLESALHAYIEEAVSERLKKSDLEITDALTIIQAEYKRLADLFEKVFSEPQLVFINVKEGEKPKKRAENATSE